MLSVDLNTRTARKAVKQVGERRYFNGKVSQERRGVIKENIGNGDTENGFQRGIRRRNGNTHGQVANQ